MAELTKEQLDVVEKLKGRRDSGLWDPRCKQYFEAKAKKETTSAVKEADKGYTIEDDPSFWLNYGFLSWRRRLR